MNPFFRKNSKKKNHRQTPHCPNCGMQVTEPAWQACPRCGKNLPHGCGCGGCGKCGH